METLTNFAGFPPCTATEQLQKFLAILIGLGLLVGLTIGTIHLLKYVKRSKLDRKLKIVLYVLAATLALPVCLGIPIVVTFILSPWCR